MATIGKNQFFEIKNGDGSSFHNLVLRKSAVESIVMSLGDKISGDVYYKDNTLSVTMHEYITYNGVNYMLINPPTIVKEGVVSDNSELKGMTKYSFVFYHPMCLLSNFPFTDVAVTSDETRYLSESKVFSWIGKPADFVAKMNKNLVGTEWIVELSSRFPQDKLNELSDVIPFDNATIADACKIFYDTWGVPYVVDKVASTETSYAAGKRFKLVMGLPSNEIYENAQAEQQNTPFVFQMGQGVGLKNNSRTPRNNKIITRISGYGSENNIPYGYPQVRWYGTAGQAFTYGDHAGVYNNVTIEGVHFDKIISYPIYKGILDGEYVELIKHPFTRTHLMPSVYRTTLFNKISFYDAAGEANTDYDPDITLVDYYDAVYSAQYPYPNTINLQAPSYESHEFEDEKPELGEAHIISATPLNNDLTPASSWDDSLDDEGNYKQSYFQMVLPQLSFDLYACASITEEMQINMRSGACLGCTFTVQVDWDDYKRNFYDEDGNFAPNGSQRDLTKYPKSNQGSISLILQKDNSTFGTLMPNMYQYPKGETSTGAADGDTFVILGISLPESYIFAAEWRLDADMKSYMLENNVHYFDYPLKFDEDFLFHNENILSQIRPNTIVRFNYAGQTQALFVKQITVKYGDQPLPQYDITLTDNVEVVLNQIGQVAEDVEKLSTLIAILRQSYGKNVWNELAKKLSKTQDDTAAGYITMLKGLQVGANFVPDILGEGGCLRMRQDGKVELVTDILYARMRAYFDSVVIREYRHESGNRIKSPAQGFNASRVEYIKVVSGTETIVNNASEADFFRCYWRVDDGEKKAENQFVVGDLAFCEHSDIVNGSLVTKRYWRVVTGRNAGNTTTADGEAWIDLSNAKDGSGNPVMTTITYEGQGGTTQTKSVLSFESGSGYPEAHDDICMLGCTTDTTRQGAIIEYVSGVNAPTYQIYQGLGADATNPYVLTNKNQISLGYSTSTGKAYMNVYGDTYIGDRNRNTFLEYKQSGVGGNPELNIKAKVQILPNGSTIDGQSIPDYIKDNQNNYDDTEVQQAISDLNNAIDNLQDQIDGSIETLYGDVDPSVPANDPYKDYTVDEKEKHLGDMYYNSTTGYAYRYDKSVEEVGGEEVTTYFWQIIRDTGITQAIADAAAALGLADTKAKIFTTTAGTLPTPPYKVNDVWVNATYPANGSTYSNEILKCVTARAQGATANIADWAKASKYTDDSSLNDFISATYNPTINGLNEQIDRKIESWFQSADPSTDWYDDTQTPVLDVRADHVGDMWYSESTHLLKRYDSETTGEGEQAVTTYFWTTIQDQKAIDAYNNAAHAQDTADGKRRVFTAQPVDADAYDVGDLWVNATYPATGTKTYENDVLRCKTAKAAGVAFNISHWQKASKYTDDSAFNGYIDEMLNGSHTSGSSSIIAAATQRAIMSALGGSTIIEGGLMLTSMIALRQNTGTAETPQYTTWAGISGIYDNTLNEQEEYVGVKGHGIAAWYGGAKVDLEDKSNYWTEEQIAAWEALTDEQKAESPLAAKSLLRMDGSGYLATANISWNDRGQITIKNITTLSDSQNTNLLNELATFNSAFTFATEGSGSTTAVYITPQVPFESLYIGTSNANKKEVATKDWANGQFITKTWFNKFFKVHYKNNGTDAVLDPNNDFPAGATDKNIEAIFSFWTNYAISALGQGVDGSHAIGVLDDLSDVTITNPQENQVLAYNGQIWVNTAAPETYVLPQATANALGGIKIGYNDATPKTYAVALNSAGQAYVAVPWENTTYTNGTGLTLTGTTFSISQANVSTILNLLSEGNSLAEADDFLIAQFAGGGTTTTTYHRRKVSKVVNATIVKAALGTGSGTTKFLREDGNWATPAYPTNYYASDASRTANTVLAAPNGSAGAATFRALVAADIPNLGAGKITSGTLDAARLPDLSGTYAAVSRVSTLEGYFNSGAAKKADKLTTARSLWGNNFDGSADITSSIIISTAKSGETDKYIQIGNIKLVYDSSNEAIKVVHTVANKVASLWADGGIAALGSTGSGGGGGGQGDVTWTLLASTRDTTDRTIDISYLTESLATMTSYTTSGQNYKVQEDSSHHLYVNVPWSNTTYTNGTGLALSSNQFSINSTYQTYISHGESAYNSLSSYLPLSGGTLSNAHFGGALTIERSGSTNFAAIGFKNSNGMLGYLAVNTVNASFVRYCIDTNTSYTILDSSNSSVSLSGSTLTVKINGTSQSLTNTNTWRGMQNNLTTSSSGTSDSLSAYQGYLLANGSARDNTKVPLAGTSTISPITGVLYIKDTDGLYINSNNIDLNVWQVVGNSGSWASQYGFTLQYLGTGSGNDNDLILWAHNGSGTHQESYRIHQDGQFIFASTPKVGTATVITSSTIGSQSVAYATSAGSASTATTASKLSTVSKTAWGQTYWTSGGVPDSISGALSSVTNITMSGYIKIGSAYLSYDSTNTALRISANADGSGAMNLYAVGGVSALGSSSSGGGGGGQGDVTWDLLKSSDTRQINISHLAGDANYAGVMSILTGYTTSGKNYKVQEDSNHHLYVNVPWTDTTYSASTGLSLSGTAFSVSYAPKVLGSYTSNGGQQNPNYFGTNRVGFLMMNTTVNGNSQYKDWVIMDCYNGSDVGGGVAIGVNRQSLGAYIMRSAAARTSWDEKAELCGTHNSSVSLSGSTLTVKIAGVEKSLTNTWRGIQDNLTSSSNTTESLSAKQGYLLANGSARDNTKVPLAGTSTSAPITGTLHIQDVDGIKVRSNNLDLKVWEVTGNNTSWESSYGFYLLYKGTGSSNYNTLELVADNQGTTGHVTAMEVYQDGTIRFASTPSVGTTAVSLNGHTHSYLPLSGGTMTGSITMSQGASARNVGIIGTYDYTKAAAIWCMGSSYQIPSDGSSLGSLYGAAYVYQSQAGQGVMGGSHQFVWGINGTAEVALGEYVWARNGFKKKDSSDSYVLLGGGGHAAISGLSVSYASSAGAVAWGNVSSKPTTLSGYGITDGMYSTQVSVSQSDTTYAKDASKTIRRGFVYNNSGTEWSYLFGFTSSSNSTTGYPSYGAVYKFGYTDRYIRVLRVDSGGTWKSTDWEKTYAGYADSAGSATNDSDGNAINSTYLKKSGGTMTGGLQISAANWAGQLVLNRTSAGSSWGPSVIFSYDSTVHGSLTMYDNQLYIGDNGSNRYLALHQGNISPSITSTASGTTTKITVGGIASSDVTINYATKATYCADFQQGLGGGDRYMWMSWSDNSGRPIYNPSFTINLTSNQLKVPNIYASGNVGIGVSPSYKLHVNGESYFESWMFVNSSVTALGIELQPSSSSAGHGGHIDFHYNKSSADYTTRLIEDASGRLKLIGDFYATGGVTALVATSSDIRKKNVVSYDLPLTLNQIADAPTIKFTWKDKPNLGEQVGSIAQYWQKVLPQTIRTEKDDTLSLQYGVAALVATITTARKVVDHEARIKALEKECADWKQAYSFLERAYNELKLKIA